MGRPLFSLALDLPARGSGELLLPALHRQLRAAILDGRLAPGLRLPSTRTLALLAGVSRSTATQAYDLLLAEGYVEGRRGSGTYVCERPAAALPGPADAPLAHKLAAPWRGMALRPMPATPLRFDFRAGYPDQRLFPFDTWRRLASREWRRAARGNGSGSDPQGDPALRAAIAQHVSHTRAVACTADHVIVTAGAQQAFDLIARILVTPGRTRAALENPGYPPLHACLERAGALLHDTPVDAEGLCVERLPRRIDLIGVSPSHQSPLGVTMSSARRHALLAHARAADALLIEDDYDGEFRFGSRPLDALQTLDRDGLVFYIGTFSKSLFPSLRKGFIVAPRWARDALITVKHCADSHSDTVTQSVLAAFIRDGHLARHVRRMRAVYAPRREALLAALDAELAPWLRSIPSEAGMHLAARIRDPALAPAILARLPRHMPGAQSIAEYAMHAPAQPAITFGYGVIDAAEIRPATRAFARDLARIGSD